MTAWQIFKEIVIMCVFVAVTVLSIYAVWGKP